MVMFWKVTCALAMSGFTLVRGVPLQVTHKPSMDSTTPTPAPGTSIDQASLDMNKICQDNDKTTVYEKALKMCISCFSCDPESKDDHCVTCRAIATTVRPYPTTRQPAESSQGPTKSDFGILVTGTDQRQTETSTEDGRSTPTLSRENASKSEFGIFPGIVSTIVTVAAVIGLFVIAFKFFKIRRNKRRQGQIPATSLRQGEIETCLQGSQEQPGVVAQETLPADEYHPLNPDSLTSTALQETCV